ncbi:MAG: tyrosine-protein phosphatase [Steroidobacteraceae bacterium]
MSAGVPGLIELEGGCNFRAIAACRSRDGRQLRTGLLFRSGVLSYITPDDHRRLLPLAIRTILDLRRAEERRREPTRWSDVRATVLHRENSADPPPVLRYALHHSPGPGETRQAMLELYRAMPESQAERLRALFEVLLTREAPLLVHCSAGKDRTGFVIAVLLEILGISREQILRDYALTNQAVDLERFVFEHRSSAAGVAEGLHPLLRVAPQVRRVLFAADPAYLNAAFERLEADYGSVQGYLSGRLGLSGQAVTGLRDVMLCATGAAEGLDG